MGNLLNEGFGIEELGTEVWLLLHSNLNQAIEDIQSNPVKIDLDQRVAEARGEVYEEVLMEQIQLDRNLHLHNSPSVIDPDDEPIEAFPSVSVVAFRSNPSEDDATYDQAEDYTDLFYVEFLVKASPSEGSEICGKRAYRMADAIHKVINSDRTISQTITDIGSAPSLLISQVFLKTHDEYQSDEKWRWQAGRIDYSVKKLSPLY